jgi:formylglycine-generating enzyme required for sulfatase activity
VVAAPAALGAKLIPVPAGTLEPFWAEEKNPASPEPKAPPIEVGAFSAQATAVTNADYLRFVKAHPRWRKSKVSPLFADATYLRQFAGDLTLAKGISPRAPVTHVSWFAAMAYCEAQGLRLPSTNEWEYMAAASETKANASRDQAFLNRILEWYAMGGSPRLPPVRSTYKNIYGLYDLHGLIWEWTEDFNSNFVTGESREDGTLNRNLFCGAGSFSGADKQNYAAFMRFAFRSSMTGKGSVWNLGFRCVK